MELPVYRIKLDETEFELLKKVPARDSRIWGNDIPNPLGSPWGGSTPDPLASLGNWWFRREHVEFYELLHPEVCGPVAHSNSTWVTPSQLILGLKISLEKLLCLAAYKGLRPYMLTRQQGLRKILPKYIWFYGFTGCLFNTDEALSFVRANPDLYGLRKVKDEQRDHLEARAYAKGRWEQDPTITIQAMAEDIEQTLNFRREKRYKLETIYNWIKDLCPNRKPGRRKKKT